MDAEQPFETLIPTPVEIPLPRWEYGLAKLISGIFSPPLMVTVGLLFLGQQLGPQGMNWALFQIALGILLPVIYIVIQVQRGQITDFHMKVREQRIRPMLLTLLLSGVSWGVMMTFGAPYALLVFGGVAILQAAFMLLVTLKWKISGHSMTIAGMAVFLFGMFGWPALPVLVTIPLVAWARVRLSRHDRWQTLAGTGVGIVFTILALIYYFQTCGGMSLVCAN